MCLDPDPRQRDWLGDATQDVPNIQLDSAIVYSPQLINLVSGCLAPDPNDRPDFHWLVNQIEVFINELGPDLAFGMRMPAVFANPLNRAVMQVQNVPFDFYALGMAQAALPPLQLG